MSSTSLLAVATLLVAGSVRADDVQPRPIAVATARAQIMSGVRVGAVRDADPARQPKRPRPRERPCPEATERPCRLIIVDMP